MGFNRLSDGEAERLAWLAEECAEVIQMVGKVLRHGYDSCHPDGGPDNRALLEAEIRDVRTVIALMCYRGDTDPESTAYADSLSKYLHHQDEA